MIIVKPSATFRWMTPNILEEIESAGRVAYKSEHKITAESAEPFVRGLIKMGHDSVLEHGIMSYHLVCDRGVSHELVRHRIGVAFTQESSRYVGYSERLMPDPLMSVPRAIELYEGGLSMRRVSELSTGRITEWEMYKHLNKAGVPRRPIGNHGTICDTFFDQIDTPEKAYLLGFIQADGNLRKDCKTSSWQVSITQKNGWFLKQMVANFIKPSVHGSKDGDCHQYSFSNERLYKALLNKGIVPNKSYAMTDANADTLWASVPDDLKADFLRGFMDGDGHLRFYQQANKGKTVSCRIGWSGNRRLLENIAGWLKIMYGNAGKVNRVSGCASLCRVEVSKPSVGDVLCRDMYRNFVFPYGHPVKTSRAWDRLKFPYTCAQIGHDKFAAVNPFEGLSPALWTWAEAMSAAEDGYAGMMCAGHAPQIARSVLPTCLKTEIRVTANIREWRHILKMRWQNQKAHPQMRSLMEMVALDAVQRCPCLFDDIVPGSAV